MKTLLQELRPRQELGPKLTCMPGTRVETINYLLRWIAEYDDASFGVVVWQGRAKVRLSAPSIIFSAFI